MSVGDILLIEDETILRLFPPLRFAWAMKGEQAKVRITGCNAKRVLFGAINPRTGYRVLRRAKRMSQADFQSFLRAVKKCYPGKRVWMLLDKASCHTAPKSQALAQALDIVLIWLPKQCSELNSMDHLWRKLKDNMSANHQFKTIDESADFAERWVLNLSRHQALLKAGILSKNFWLKYFSKNFCKPT